MTNYKYNSTYITSRPIFLADRNSLTEKAKAYGLELTSDEASNPELLANAIAQHESLMAEYSRQNHQIPEIAKANSKRIIGEDDTWGVYELDLLQQAAFFNICVDVMHIKWRDLESAVSYCVEVTDRANECGISWEPYLLEINELVDKIEAYEDSEYISKQESISDYYHSIRLV